MPRRGACQRAQPIEWREQDECRRRVIQTIEPDRLAVEMAVNLADAARHAAGSYQRMDARGGCTWQIERTKRVRQTA